MAFSAATTLSCANLVRLSKPTRFRLILALTAPIFVFTLATAPRPAIARTMASAEIEQIPALLPSVVNISFTKIVPGTNGAPPRRTHGVGSGFILGAAGEIVTNYHVVGGTSEIIVTLQDNTQLSAEVLAESPEADLALLRVHPDKPLPTVTLGDSDKLQVGETVIAIGNPLGLGGSVSSGIVSGLNRDIHATEFDSFIQTDAAINHGNSGGPLFDSRGQVIGMNAAIYSPTDDSGSIGLGFAIPINIVKFVVGQLHRYGRVRPGWIGLTYQPVTSEIANAIGLARPEGAIVSRIDADSPAQRAGLRPGDVILDFAQKHPGDSRALSREIGMTPRDTTVQLVIWRDNSQLTLPITVSEQPGSSTPMATPAGMRQVVAMQSPEMGLRLAALTDDLRKKYSLAPTQGGVAIQRILPGTIAAERGLVEGDVIMDVQRQPVSTPDDVIARIGDAKARDLRYAVLLIRGQDGTRWITLPLKP